MKDISKSIRLSKEIYDYIMEFDGAGFNEKFENIIVFAMKNEIETKKRLTNLNELIESRSSELSELNASLLSARSETNKYKQVLNSLKYIGN